MALLEDINAEMASRAAASGAAPAGGSDATAAPVSPLKDAIDAEIASRQAAAPAPVATPGLGIFPSDKDYVAPLTTTYPDSVPFAKQLNYMHDLSRQTTRMFGGDYVNAAARSIGNMVSGKPADYSGALAQERRDSDAFAGANPAMSTAAALTGGLAAAPVAGLAAPTSTAAAIGAGVKAGAPLGALGGAGYSHGQTLGEVATDAAKGGVGGALIGGTLPAVGAAGKTVLQRLAPNAAVDSQLGKIIQTDAAAGGPTVSDMQATLAQTPDKPLMLADVLGEGNPVGTLYRGGGAPKQIIRTAVNERDTGAGQRMKDDTRQFISGLDANQAADDLISEQEAASRPAYAAANSVGTLSSPGLDNLIAKSRHIQSAIAEAKSFPRYADLPDNDMRVLDQAYKNIGGAAQVAKQSGNGPLKHNLGGLQGDFKDEIVALNPKYGEALDAFSGPAQSRDAIEAGGNIFKSDPADTAKIIAGLTPGDRDLFLAGAAKAIRNRVSDTTGGGNEALKVMGKEAIGEKLRPLFNSDADFNAYMDSAGAENKMFQTTRRTTGGSETQERYVADGGGKGNGAAGIGAITALASGNLPAAGGIMAAKGLQRFTGPTQASKMALARALTTPQTSPVTEGMQYGLDRSMLPSDQLARLAQALKQPSLMTPGTAIAAEQGGPAATDATLRAGPYAVGLWRALQQHLDGGH